MKRLITLSCILVLVGGCVAAQPPASTAPPTTQPSVQPPVTVNVITPAQAGQIASTIATAVPAVQAIGAEANSTDSTAQKVQTIATQGQSINNSIPSPYQTDINLALMVVAAIAGAFAHSKGVASGAAAANGPAPATPAKTS